MPCELAMGFYKKLDSQLTDSSVYGIHSMDGPSTNWKIIELLKGTLKNSEYNLILSHGAFQSSTEPINHLTL